LTREALGVSLSSRLRLAGTLKSGSDRVQAVESASRTFDAEKACIRSIVA
jgi:hypothetical protein